MADSDGAKDFGKLVATFKKTVKALDDAGVDFVVAGGLASWSHGGPKPTDDLDLIVRPADIDRGLEALAGAGMRTERPAEQFLVKAWDDDVLVDLIHEVAGVTVDDSHFDRAIETDVEAVKVKVQSPDDLLVNFLRVLGERHLDYETPLEHSRAWRERVDWAAVREAVKDSPYAGAFFTLAEDLGVAPSASDR